MLLTLPDGCGIHAEVHGPADAAVTVLFVHGFPLSGRMWDRTVAGLAGESVRCIVPDLCGHGRSGVRDAVTIGQFADDLAGRGGVLDLLGIRGPVVVCGLSMGGIVAFEMYRRHAGRVRGLVLCDTRAEPESPAGAALRHERARLALERGSRAVAALMIGAVLSPNPDPGVAAEVLEMMSATPARGLAAASVALAERADSRGTLPTIGVPTLYVVGDDDQITTPDLVRGLHEATPGSEFVRIPGAGHVPPMENSHAFTAALSAFLRSLVAGERA